MKLRQQSGFTLIELVMVIVILGILAATALPRFVNLRGDAATAAVQGVAGALGAAASINRAARAVSTSSGSAVADCTAVEALLDGGLSSEYTILTGTVASGSAVTCTVTNTANSVSATFVAYGT